MNRSLTYPIIKKNCGVHYFSENQFIVLDRIIRDKVDPVVIEVLDLCDGRNTINDLLNILFKKFHVKEKDKPLVEETVGKFIGSLIKDGTIELLEKPTETALKPIKKSGEKGKRFPYLAVLELTDLCNFSCAHCYKDAKISNNYHMSFEKIKYVLDKLRGKTPVLNLTGGESSLYPFINDTIDYCDGYNIILLTNGSNIDKIGHSQLKKLYFAQVSMYGGSAKAYEIITGKSINFTHFLNGLDILKANGLPVRVAVMLNKIVIDELHECLEILVDKKVKEVVFGLTIVEGRRVGEDISSIWNLNAIDIKKVDDIIEKLKEQYKDFIYFGNPYKLSIGLKWHKDPDNYELTCSGGSHVVTFSNRGFVKACNFMPDGPFDMGSYENYLQKIEEDHIFSFKEGMKAYEQILKSRGKSFTDFFCRGMCGEMKL